MEHLIPDIFNVQLTCIGIIVSLFTLVYSFIMSKKNELKIISERIKLGETSVSVKQLEKFAHNYIGKMKLLNKYLLIFGACSLLIWFLTWLDKIIFNCQCSYLNLLIVITSCIEFLALAIFLIIFLKNYFRQTK